MLEEGRSMTIIWTVIKCMYISCYPKEIWKTARWILIFLWIVFICYRYQREFLFWEALYLEFLLGQCWWGKSSEDCVQKGSLWVTGQVMMRWRRQGGICWVILFLPNSEMVCPAKRFKELEILTCLFEVDIIQMFLNIS